MLGVEHTYKCSLLKYIYRTVFKKKKNSIRIHFDPDSYNAMLMDMKGLNNSDPVTIQSWWCLGVTSTGFTSTVFTPTGFPYTGLTSTGNTPPYLVGVLPIFTNWRATFILGVLPVFYYLLIKKKCQYWIFQNFRVLR